MKNIRKLFPSKLPYITKSSTYIPEDMPSKLPDGLIGNDMLYLIAYHADMDKSDRDARDKILESCMRSRTSEWRRKKRLQKLGLI